MKLARQAGVACTILVLAACGGNATSDLDLPPTALEGREVVRQNGCAACHGKDGGGGVGPELVGLFRRDVSLETGETVTADREYLRTAIVEPNAQIVEGYTLPMPKVDLTEDEIDAIIDYIEAIGPDVEPASP